MENYQKLIHKRHSRLILCSFLFLFAINHLFIGLYPITRNEPLLAERNDFQFFPSSQSITPGQRVVDYFRQVFSYDWNFGNDYDFIDDGTGFPQSRTIYGSSYSPFLPARVNGSMRILPILSPDNAEAKILDLINSANVSLAIEQMYFYNDLTDIKTAIIAAHTRGVNVTIILDDGNSNSNSTVSDLLDVGIQVKVSDGYVPIYFNTQHNKGVIVDEKIVLISSINWSPTSLYDNREAGLIIESDPVAQYYQQLYDHDWSVCDPFILYESSSNKDFSHSGSPPLTYLPSSPLSAQDYDPIFANVEPIDGSFTLDLLASPDNAFNTVAELLNSANESVDLSIYTLSSPYIIDILAAKLAEGLQIRLLLEKYPVNSYERNYNRHSLFNLTILGHPLNSNPTINHTGIGKWARSDFTFQHSKYAIIDNKTLILSSGNWGRSSLPKPRVDGSVDGNRDWFVVVYGENPGPLNSIIPEDTEDTSTSISTNTDPYPTLPVDSIIDFIWANRFLLLFIFLGALVIGVLGLLIYRKIQG